MVGPGQNGNLPLAEHERLIKRLYEPGADVDRINAVLTSYQRSQQGWLLADQSLQSQDANVRFFGALTFTIKINTDWDTLSLVNATSLLPRLMSWLIRLVRAGDNPLVIRKLCSALVAYFLRPSTSWDRCLRHLICCLVVGTYFHPREMFQLGSTVELLARLNHLQLKTSLWFSTTLVEELGKTNSNNSHVHQRHEEVALNLVDAVALLDVLLSQPNSSKDQVQEAVKCSQAWVNYAHRSVTVNAFTWGLDGLRSLNRLLLWRLATQDFFEVTVDFFAETLVSFPAFFDADTYSSLATFLTNETAKQWVSTLIAGDFEGDAQDYSRLLFAYGDATVQHLARNTHDHRLQQILEQLLDLVDAEGYEGEDLQICSQAIEFWQAYTEFVTDSLPTSGETQEPWMDVAKQYIAKALRHSWVKIRFPDPQVFTSWDSEIKGDFKALRHDFTDLVQASFALLGLSAFEHFAQLTLDSLGSRAWYDLEASLFGLNALSDSVANDASSDETLSMIFKSTLFADMMSATAAAPFQTHATALGTAANYIPFFQRQTEFLPRLFNFLFTFLGHSTLANSAAKAISSACSLCRKQLTPQINGFFQAYQRYSQADPGVREKIIGAIAMIVQALPSDEDKMGPLSSLLAYVERDAAYCYQAKAANRNDEALNSGLCVLRCLSSIGKALQVPDGDVIDLEAEDSSLNLWASPIGADLQTRVTHLLHAVTGSLGFNNTIIEAGCHVLRTGYKETTRGLLVLHPQVSVDFVAWGCTSGLSFTGLAYVIETAAAMLAKRKDASTTAMIDAASSIWSHVSGAIQIPTHHSIEDPDITACYINLAEKMIPHYFQSFFSPSNPDSLPGFFSLSIRSLVTPGVIPKRAAASFWATFVQKHELTPFLDEQVQAVMKEYGPQLCHALIRNIGGEAARSELDILSLPLKKLVFAQPQAKQWLSDALGSTSFVSDKVDSTGKRLWLQKIMSLRGGGLTNQTVREFWMICRGTNMDYAS